MSKPTNHDKEEKIIAEHELKVIEEQKLLAEGTIKSDSIMTTRDIKYQNLIADLAHTYALEAKKAKSGSDDVLNKKIAIEGQIFSLKRQRSNIPEILKGEVGHIVRVGDKQVALIDFDTLCGLMAYQKAVPNSGAA